jgi:hypothetical protein
MTSIRIAAALKRGSNIASILKPPLPETDRRILAKHFGHLVGIGLDPPTYMPGLVPR